MIARDKKSCSKTPSPSEYEQRHQNRQGMNWFEVESELRQWLARGGLISMQRDARFLRKESRKKPR